MAFNVAECGFINNLAFISFDERFTLTDDTVQFQYAPPADWSHCRYCSSTRLAGWCERQTESPRLIVESVPTMAQSCRGPLAEDYRVVKARADAAVRRG